MPSIPSPVGTPSYNKTPIAATTPAAKPISGINLTPAPVVPVAAGAATVVVDAAVLDAAAEEVEAAPAPSFTDFGSRSPHLVFLQLSAPGLAWLQTLKTWSHSFCGRVSRYWSRFSGSLPLAQVQFQVKVSC